MPANWYEAERPGSGHEFEEFIALALQRIQELPLAHPTVVGNVRRLVLQRFPYSILYRVKPKHISVIAIYHQHRDPRGWQERV